MSTACRIQKCNLEVQLRVSSVRFKGRENEPKTVISSAGVYRLSFNGRDCLLVGDRLASLLNLNSSPPVLSTICYRNIVLPTLYTAVQLLLAAGWLTLSACMLRQEIEYSDSLQTIASLNYTAETPNRG